MRKKWQQFRAFSERFTKDKHGKTVLWQRPNYALMTWFGTMVLAWLFGGRLEHLFSQISFGALFAWAWMEIFLGASMFRRGLGTLVLLWLLISTLR